MNGLTVLMRKDLLETMRTWKLPTLLGMLIFFAIMSPVIALITPQLVGSIASSAPGMRIELPDPVYMDSYAQWIKNLSQVVLIVVVFAAGGLIASDRTAGHATFVAVKPVSRPAVVVSKYVALMGVVSAVTVLGTAIVGLGTRIAFADAPFGPVIESTALWLASVCVIAAFAELFSVFMPTVAAGFLTLVVTGLGSVLAMWEPASKYSPVGLLGAPGDVLAGKETAATIPLVTAVILVVLLLAAAASMFSHKEL